MKMSGSQTKGLPLTKEEVMVLVNLVETNSIITSKVTNAANNQLKDSAWQKVTQIFNASITSCPRRPEQLRLKWENIKKSARKRSSRIRMNNLKTGGGKPDYIPPDETLDKVASILGATCDGYSVSFGGDAEAPEEKTIEIHQEVHNNFEIVGNVLSSGENEEIEKVKDAQALPNTPKPKKFFFSSGGSVGKQKRDSAKTEEIVIRNERNKAIAEYYAAKKEKIQLEIEILKLQVKKLKTPEPDA